MKEIIAERDKSFFLIVAAVGAVSASGSIIGSVYMPRFMWFYILGASVMGLIALVGAIGLCFPKWVIIREGNAVIIHNGFRGLKKIRIEITDIVGAKIQDIPQQSAAVKPNGNIVLTVKSDNASTKDIVIINIKNHSEAVDKLNSLIQQR